MTILVTGGAGFIGQNFCQIWSKRNKERIVVLDALTYASKSKNLHSTESPYKNEVVKGDIGDKNLVTRILSELRPRVLLNLAAETHVDRSIEDPGSFIDSNIYGTFNLLECCRTYIAKNKKRASSFKFIQVSTDEVFGDLHIDEEAFVEDSAYQPSSPYSASKAASDHLVRAWERTFNVPSIITYCSNNYGPWQHHEKFIPTIIRNAISGSRIPIYGDGSNVRDWLYVTDHCQALMKVLEEGRVGESYGIGANNEITNISLAKKLCRILDHARPRPDGGDYESQIEFIQDRPGHDQRYAINSRKIREALFWRPKVSPKEGLERTVQWYLQEPQVSLGIRDLK